MQKWKLCVHVSHETLFNIALHSLYVSISMRVRPRYIPADVCFSAMNAISASFWLAAILAGDFVFLAHQIFNKCCKIQL